MWLALPGGVIRSGVVHRVQSVGVLLLAALAGCGDKRTQRESTRQQAPLPAASGSTSAADSANPQQDEAAADCARAIDEALKLPPLPGAPALDAAREEILMRAKARPVVFLQTPKASEHTALAQHAWTSLSTVSQSALAFYGSYASLARHPAIARELFLREGYLFADEVQLAMGLANAVRLEDLFEDEQIWIHRANEILEVHRRIESSEPIYRYVTGPEQGQRATLLLLDRVAVDRAALARPLHRDFSALQAELGFQAAKLEFLSEQKIVANLRYGEIWVRTLLQSGEDAGLALECEVTTAEDMRRIAPIRDHQRRLVEVMTSLRRVIGIEMEESLPFDEPKTEFGQEDGKLRQAWSWAYRFGRSHFEHNEDRYRVFDHQGRPRVPQVCIDFITDTLERASGTWYRNRGEPRERIRGRLDFNDYGIENRRSVESFVGFVDQHPEWFEVSHLTPQERIPFQRRGAFYDYLRAQRGKFRVGNIVTILGLRDDDREHYHSFFVYDVDPITQLPIWLASNAGRPRIRVWENEMGNAPKRSIKSVIQPKLEWWVERVLGGRAGDDGAAAENSAANGH